MENIYWKRAVGMLIMAVWLYTLAGFVGSVANIIGIISDVMSEEVAFTETLNMENVLGMFCSFFVFVGYFLFFHSLSRFERLQGDETDKKSVRKIRRGYLILLIAFISDFIPEYGKIVNLFFFILAYIQLLSGYNRLKKSSILPLKVREGFARLYACTMGVFGGFLVSDFIGSVVSFFLFFIILKAWKKIRLGGPEITKDESVAIANSASPYHVEVLGDCLIAFFMVEVLVDALMVALQLNWFPECHWRFQMHDGTTKMIPMVGEALSYIRDFFGILLFSWMFYSKDIKISASARKCLGVLALFSVIYPVLMFVKRLLVPVDLLLPVGMCMNALFLVKCVVMILFVRGTNLDKGIKVLVGTYSPLALLLSYVSPLVWGLCLSFSESNERWQLVLNNIILIQAFVYLLIGIIYLVWAWRMIGKWKNSLVGMDTTSSINRGSDVDLT